MNVRRIRRLVLMSGLMVISTMSAIAQVDPTIPLRFQAPQQPDMLEMLRKAQQLKIQQQQIQLQQQEIEQRQRDLDEQRIEAQRVRSAPEGSLKVPPLTALIKPEQYAAFGLTKLNAVEAAHLDSWLTVFLTAYTKNLYEGIVSQRAASSVLDAESASVEEVLQDGEVIRMLNGSEWQVRGGESVESSQWIAPTDVMIVTVPNSRVALLIHDGDAVHATRIK